MTIDGHALASLLAATPQILQAAASAAATAAALPSSAAGVPTPLPNPGGNSPGSASPTTTGGTATGAQLPALLYTALVWAPTVLAFIVPLLRDRTVEQRNRIRSMGFGGAGLVLFFALWALQTQANNAALGTGGHADGEYSENHQWFTSFAVSAGYHLDADGIAIPLLVLSALVFVCVALFAWRNERHLRFRTVTLLLLETAVNGVICANDWVLFLLFWVMTFVLVAVLVQGWSGRSGHHGDPRVAGRTLAIGLLSTLLIAAGALLGVFQSGAHSFDIARTPLAVAPPVAAVSFWLLLSGFMLVMAVFPVHLVAVDLGERGGGSISVVTAVMLPTLGAYGLLRVVVPEFPALLADWSLVLCGLAVAGSVWGAVAALRSDDLRRLVAYVGVSLMSAVLLGIAVHTSVSLTGVTFVLVARGLALALLLVVAQAIHDRARGVSVRQLGGLALLAPRLTSYWLVAALCAIGVPLLANFSGFLLLFTGSFAGHRVSTVLVLATVVVSGLALLVAAARVFLGPLRESLQKARDVDHVEQFACALLTAFIVIFGIFPVHFTELIANGASALIAPGG